MEPYKLTDLETWLGEKAMFTKIWYALKNKFHVGGSINQTTHYVELIAMLIFWLICEVGGLRLYPDIQRKFMFLFDILDEEEEAWFQTETNPQ